MKRVRTQFPSELVTNGGVVHPKKERKLVIDSPQIDQLHDLTSAIIARSNLAGLLGRSYADKRNLYDSLGYKENLTYDDFIAQFIRQDIARAVIERPVKVTWSGPVLILETNNKEETGLEKAWLDLERELKLKSIFIRLDKLTGLGRYGALLLGLDDVSNVEGFITPVNTKDARKLLYVRPLGETGAVVSTWESNSKNPRYGLPLLYDVTLINADGTLSSIIKVHYSRIIHVVENALENETEGSPRLEAVFNRLQDLEKLTGGSAEMFWRGARPGYTGEIDPEYSMTTAEKNALPDKIDEFEHNLRRIFLQEGVKLQTLEMQIADPKSHVDIQIMMISAVTGIPKRILSGSERGELSSGQDAAEWTSYVQSRREEFAEPHIIRPFVDRMIEYQILPKPKDGYEIEWADLFAVSEKDKAEIGRIRAAALKEYFTNPLTSEVVSPKAFYEFFLGFRREQIELITEMEGDEVLESLRSEMMESEEDVVEEPVAKPKKVKKSE